MEIILNDYHKKVNAGKWSMVTLSFVIIVMRHEKNAVRINGSGLRKSGSGRRKRAIGLMKCGPG